MSSFGRKLARQNKRETPEGKAQTKEEQAKKQAALLQQQQQNQSAGNQNSTTGFTRIVRQRRSGNA